MRNTPIQLLALLLAAAPSWAAVPVPDLDLPIPFRCNAEALSKLSMLPTGETDVSLAKYLTPGGLINAEPGTTLCDVSIWGYLKKDKDQNLAWQKATSRGQQIVILRAANDLYYNLDQAARAYFKAADVVYAAGNKLKISSVEKKTLQIPSGAKSAEGAGVRSTEVSLLRLIPDPVPAEVKISLDGMDNNAQVEAVLDVAQPDPVDSKQTRPGRKIQDFYGTAVKLIRAAHIAAPDLVNDPGTTGWVNLPIKPPHPIMAIMPKVARCEGKGEACWTDAAAHPEAALDRLDMALRNRVAATNSQVNNLFNQSVAVITASSNTNVAELIAKLKKAPVEKPKNETEGATLDIEKYKELFKTETANRLFDGIDQRTKLTADDPNFLTRDQANSLKKEYGAELKGDKVVGVNASVTQVGDKLVYSVVGKPVPGAETPVPAKLTEGEAKTQAQRVADLILKGDDLAAKAAALYGAIFEPKDPVNTNTGDLTGPAIGAPKSFAEEAKAASCGSPLDIGKSNSQLAREKMNEGIASKAKDNSKARKKDESVYDDEMEAAADSESSAKDKIKAEYEQKRLNVVSNASLDADERREMLGALNSEEGAKIADLAIKRKAAQDAAKVKRDGALAQRASRAEELSKDQKEQDALIVADYDRRIPDELAKAKESYKSGSKSPARSELVSSINRTWQFEDPERLPLRAQDIDDRYFFGAPGQPKKLPKGGYFTERWEGDGGKASMTKLRGYLGISADGKLGKKLKNVDETGPYIHDDLAAWYIERILKPAEASRKKK